MKLKNVKKIIKHTYFTLEQENSIYYINFIGFENENMKIFIQYDNKLKKPKQKIQQAIKNYMKYITKEKTKKKTIENALVFDI